MIYQGVFEKGSYYQPNTFDVFFDWATLSIFGSVLFLAMIPLFYRAMKEKQVCYWYITCPACGGFFVGNIRKRAVSCPHCGTEGIMDARGFEPERIIHDERGSLPLPSAA